MTVTANGKPLLNALIEEPRLGAWTVEFDADSDEAISGALTLVVDGVTFRGTVIRGDLSSGRAHARAVAGAGGLGRVLPAKYYLGVALGSVLADIMSATGETLSAATDSRVLGFRVARWARSSAPAAQALRQVADEAGASFRMLRDGTVWLGSETWPDATVKYDETAAAPSKGSVTIAPESPTLAPGQRFLGKGTSRVTTHVSAEGTRQQALFEDDITAPSSHGRVMGDFATIVESLVGNRLDYSRQYAAKVVHQLGDGSLEVLTDDLKMRGTGITRVPIRHGIPGVNVTVPDGVRVLVFFEDGDPKKPCAALWPDGSSVTSIDITSPTLTIHGNLVVTGEITAMSTDPMNGPVHLSSHLHPSAMGPTSKPTPNT